MNPTPCDSCPAHCCRVPVVDITIPDIFVISEAFNLAASDFTEMVWQKTAEPHRRIVRSPSNGRYYRLRLKRIQEEEGRRCVFLHSVTPQRALCAAYPVRPGTCRAYPTYQTAEGEVGTRGGKFCPEGAWTIEKIDVRRARSDWSLRRRFRSMNDALVDGWNERVFHEGRAFKEERFHTFITASCQEMEALAPGVFRRPDPGVAFPDPEWPESRITEGVDQVLRSLGWRTDATATLAQPQLGRAKKEPNPEE